jgi:hypothetical protein
MKKWFQGLIAAIVLIGCTASSIVDQAKLLGGEPFSKEAWASANQEQRGRMVASFLSQHAPGTLSAQSVKQWLGPSTGYYDYDENVAYFVGPPSVQSRYGKGYLLVFIADKTSGKITAVKIIPEPRR